MPGVLDEFIELGEKKKKQKRRAVLDDFIILGEEVPVRAPEPSLPKITSKPPPSKPAPLSSPAEIPTPPDWAQRMGIKPEEWVRMVVDRPKDTSRLKAFIGGAGRAGVSMAGATLAGSIPGVGTLGSMALMLGGAVGSGAVTDKLLNRMTQDPIMGHWARSMKASMAQYPGYTEAGSFVADAPFIAKSIPRSLENIYVGKLTGKLGQAVKQELKRFGVTTAFGTALDQAINRSLGGDPTLPQSLLRGVAVGLSTHSPYQPRQKMQAKMRHVRALLERIAEQEAKAVKELRGGQAFRDLNKAIADAYKAKDLRRLGEATDALQALYSKKTAKHVKPELYHELYRQLEDVYRLHGPDVNVLAAARAAREKVALEGPGSEKYQKLSEELERARAAGDKQRVQQIEQTMAAIEDQYMRVQDRWSEGYFPPSEGGAVGERGLAPAWKQLEHQFLETSGEYRQAKELRRQAAEIPDDAIDDPENLTQKLALLTTADRLERTARAQTDAVQKIVTALAEANDMDPEAFVRERIKWVEPGTPEQAREAAALIATMGDDMNVLSKIPGGKPLTPKQLQESVPGPLYEHYGLNEFVKGRKKITRRDVAEWLKGRDIAMGQPKEPIPPADVVLKQLKQTGFIPARDTIRMLKADEFPEYLYGVLQFMDEQRKKFLEGKLTIRDVAKAYYMTVASIQASGIEPNLVAQKGLDIADKYLVAGKTGTPQIRPEDGIGAWLLSKTGKRALDALEKGKLDMKAWAEGERVRSAWGQQTLYTKPKAGQTSIFQKPNTKKGEISMHNLQELVDLLNESGGDPDKVAAAVSRLRGIGDGKKGFLMHLLGFGEVPTIDMNEINYWLTGEADIRKLETKAAKLAGWVKEKIKSPGRVKTYVYDKITKRLEEVAREVFKDSDIPKEYQMHILHHWLFDKIQGLENPHWGLREAQQFAQGASTPENLSRFLGGTRVVDESGAPAPVYHGTSRAGFTAFDPERFDPNALYGPGIYLTDHPGVAGGEVSSGTPGYARKRNISIQDRKDIKRLLSQHPAIKLLRKDPGWKGRIDYALRAYSKDSGPILRLSAEIRRSKKIPQHIAQSFDPVKITRDFMTSKSGVYKLWAKISNPFDVQKNVSAAEAREFLDRAMAFGGLSPQDESVRRVQVQLGKEKTLTNHDLYRSAEILFSKSGKRKAVNRFLRSLGYDGIKYPGGKRVGKVPHQAWVAFEPNQVKSATGNVGTFDPGSANLLSQDAPAPLKGLIRFTKDLRGFIQGFEDADVTTMPHEIAHLFRRHLPKDLLEAANKWAKVEKGRPWTRKQEERWANAFVRYLRSGQAPTPAMQEVFDRYNRWIMRLYPTIKGTELNVGSRKVDAVFDELLTPKHEPIERPPPTTEPMVLSEPEVPRFPVNPEYRPIARAFTDVSLEGQLTMKRTYERVARELDEMGRHEDAFKVRMKLRDQQDAFIASTGGGSIAADQISTAFRDVYGDEWARALPEPMQKAMGVRKPLTKEQQRVLDMYIMAQNTLLATRRKMFKGQRLASPMTMPQARAIIEQVESRPDAPLLRSRAERWNDATQSFILKPLHEAGLLSDAQYRALQDIPVYQRRQFIQHNYPDISPLDSKRRIVSVEDTGIRELKHGDVRALSVNAKANLEGAISDVQDRIAKNEALKELYNLAEYSPDKEFLRVATPKEEAGRASIPSGKVPLGVYLDGEKHYIIADQRFARSWTRVQPELKGVFAGVLGWLSGAKLVRLGAVGVNPGWGIFNLAIDTPTAFLNTPAWTHHWYEKALPLIGMKRMIRDYKAVMRDVATNGPLTKRYLAARGGFPTLASSGRETSILRSPEMKKVGETLGWVGDFTEKWSRVAIFKAMLDNLQPEIAAGNMTLAQAERHAAAAAKSMLDYTRGGGITKTLDIVMPFLHAGVAATRDTFRSFLRNPAGFSWKAANILAPMVAVRLAERAMYPDASKDISWRDRLNYLTIFTGTHRVDEKGRKRYSYTVIPKSPALRLFSVLADAIVDRILSGETPPDLGKQVLAGAELMLPLIPDVSPMPPTVQAIQGYRSNWNYFQGRPIWTGPNVRPEDEIGRRATGMTTDVAQALGMSPERLQYAVSTVLPPNVWFSMPGVAWESMTGRLPKDQQKEMNGILHRLLLQRSGRKLIRETYPREVFEGWELRRALEQEYHSMSQHALDLVQQAVKAAQAGDEESAREQMRAAANLVESFSLSAMKRINEHSELFDDPERMQQRYTYQAQEMDRLLGRALPRETPPIESAGILNILRRMTGLRPRPPRPPRPRPPLRIYRAPK